MITAFDHVHLYARDFESAMDFWTRVMGADRIGMVGKNHLLLLGGQFIALCKYPEELEPSELPAVGDGALHTGHGVAHLGLNVTSLELWATRLESEGYPMHSEIRGGAPLRFVYFTAPDGVVVELTEYVLPRKLAPAELFLRLFNGSIHRAKRILGRALVSAASS